MPDTKKEGTVVGIGIEDCEVGIEPPKDIALAPIYILTINNLKMKQRETNDVGLVLRLANEHKVISLGQLLILSHAHLQK